MGKRNNIITENFGKIFSILRNETGQAAVEHSLLLGIFSSAGVTINNPLIAVGIILSVIIVLAVLLVWKTKYFFFAIILLALLYAASVYLRH